MVTSVGAGTAIQTGRNAPVAKAQDISSDFNAFLRMLTTQMKHQDPMNPVESTDFSVQLATFAGVEQQAQTNKLLNELALQLGGAGLGQVADWIGKEARTTGPVWFGTNPLSLDINPDSLANSVILVTLDASGQEVMREEIGLGAGQVDWYGRDVNGDKLASGAYSFRTESLFDGVMISEQEVSAYARISEAETGADGLRLILEGGLSVLASEVQALREVR